MDNNKKQVNVSTKTHRKLSAIKFYGGIDISTCADAMIQHCLKVDVLRDVLLEITGDPKKVAHILKKMSE